MRLFAETRLMRKKYEEQSSFKLRFCASPATEAGVSPPAITAQLPERNGHNYKSILDKKSAFANSTNTLSRRIVSL